MRFLSGASLLFAIALTSACDASKPAGWQVIAQEGSSLNGSSLNGSSLNGSSLNGPDLSNAPETTLASVSLAGVKIGGSHELDEAWLDGSEIKGRKGSADYAGEDFVQAELEGALANDDGVRLRIREVAAEGDVWRYRVEYRDGESWWPICTRDGVAVDAYALSGTWNLAFGTPQGGAKTVDGTNFTFACAQGLSALGKCVDLGYKPWATVASTTLADHHQACVRLLRADYCGNGVSHTQDGTLVNLYDGLGIQEDTENWYFEAEWDERGARCFSPLNRSGDAAPCYTHRIELGCGLGRWELGTLLVNETTDDGIL